jgi:hypothetical protein
MTKPKLKDTKSPSLKLPEKPKVKAPSIDTLDVGPNTLLAPPGDFYAVIKDDEYEPPYTLSPVVTLFHDSAQNRVVGYIPVGTEILPVNEVDGFVQYWSGDPTDFDPTTLGLADDEDDEDDDDDALEDDDNDDALEDDDNDDVKGDEDD